MSNCEDVDLTDRAHIYHSLLVSLSNKKVCICAHMLSSFDFTDLMSVPVRWMDTVVLIHEEIRKKHS